jgi:hypothetical protein
MSPWEYCHAIAWTGVIAAFMASVGVRASLGTSTAPTAMAQTIGIWLGAMAGLSLLTAILVGVGALGFVLFWVTSTQLGLQATPTPWFPIGGDTAYPLLQLLLFASLTGTIVADSRLRFDRLAGRVVPEDAWTVGEAPSKPPASASSPVAGPALTTADQSG